MNESVWKAILDREKGTAEKDIEDEMVDDETDEELEEEMEDDGWGDREFVSDISGDEESDDDGLSDLEEAAVRFRVYIWSDEVADWCP